MGIIEKGLDSVKTIFQLFNNGSLVFLLFCIALFLAYYINKKKNYVYGFIVPAFILALVVFNPLALYVVNHFFSNERVVRLFWLFPVEIVFAYFITLAVTKKESNVYKFVIICISAGSIVLSGSFMFGNGNFTKSENAYKVPNDVIEICDAIEEDGNIGLVVPSFEYIEYYRQYDANIHLAAGRSFSAEGTWQRLIRTKPYNIESMVDYMRYYGIPYIVLEKDYGMVKDIEEYDVKLICETERFKVYRLQLSWIKPI